MSRPTRRRPSVPAEPHSSRLEGGTERLCAETDPDQEIHPQILAVLLELAIERRLRELAERPVLH